MKILLKHRGAIWVAPALTIALFATAACSVRTSAASPPPLPEVRVAAVEQRDVPIYHEWKMCIRDRLHSAQ